MVVIAATLIFAKVQHFRAEAHWLKVRAVSVGFDFVGIGRINIRNVGRIIKAVGPNCQLAITIIRGRQFLLVGGFVIDVKSNILPSRGRTIGTHSLLGIVWIWL
ncbi:unknown [Eggerthella sp. CAG:209]|nr:unknown [Eggerthella sp. CAG:209]